MGSTRDKLNEASFFLTQMKLTANNKDFFRYNLSACVSALRSVTFFMQKDYAHTSHFPAWYAQKQIQMKIDKLVGFFNEQRRLTIHEKSIATRTQYQFHSPAIDMSRLAPGIPIKFSFTSQVDEDGKPTMIVHELIDPSNAIVGEASAETQWLFDELPSEDNPDNKDAVTLCEEQLHKLQELVAECEQLFQTQ